MFLILTLLLSITQLPQPVNFTEAEKDFIREHPVITIGGDPSWEPMLIQNGERIIGFDRDYLDEIERITGLRFEIVTDDWIDIIKMAQAREIDGILYSSPLNERLDYFNFTQPYVNFQTGFYGRGMNPKINVIWDVLDRRIAVQEGDQFANNFMDSLGVSSKINYKNRDEIIQALLKGEVDLYFGAMDIDYYLSNKGVVGIELQYHVLNEGHEAVYSFRKDQPELVSIINKAIDQVPHFKSRELMRKWSILPKSKLIIDKSLIKNWVLIIILLVTLLTIWIFTLRNQVRKRKKIQASLNAYKDTLQAQIENSSGIIYTLDRDFKIIIKNSNLDKFVNILNGRSVSIGDNILDFISEPNRDKWKARYERALAGEAHSREDLTEVTGELKSFVTYFNPITQNGKVTGISCFTEDVTQYTSLNRYLINLMENSNDYIFIKDINRKFIIASQSLAEINGLTSWRDMVGKTDYDINPGNAREFEEDELKVLNDQIYSINKEHSFIDHTGKKRWVESSNEPITNDAGDIIGLSGVSRDITDWKEQHMFNTTLLAAVEATGDLIVFFDHDLNFLYLNRTALEVYQDPDYLGKSLSTVLKPRVFDHIKTNIHSRVARGEVWKDEYDIHIPNTGKTIRVDSAVVKVVDEEGRFICFANVARDITEKDALKQELETVKINEAREKASKNAEEAERQRIAADLHDGVQQKIASVTIMLQSLSDPLVSNSIKVLKEAVNEIRNTAHNLSLAALSKKGLNGAIHDDVKRLGKLSDIKFEYYQNIESLRFKNEIESNLYRIYQEATSNILKYAKAQNVTIQVMYVAGLLTLQVEDDGIGFNSKDQEATGFGLQNIHKRASAMGAVMNLDSQQENGTSLMIEVNIPHHDV